MFISPWYLDNKQVLEEKFFIMLGDLVASAEHFATRFAHKIGTLA